MQGHDTHVVVPLQGSGTFSVEAAVATIVPRDGRFLLVEEDVRGQILLNQPAGHLDPGESLVSAAVREPLLSAGQVDAVTGLSFLSPINLRDRGVPLIVIDDSR